MLRFFIGTVAGLALAGTAASAAPGGNDKGHGSDHGGGRAAHGMAREGPGEAKGGGNEEGPSRSPAKTHDREDKGPAIARREERQESRAATQSPVRAKDEKHGKRDEAAKAPAKPVEKKSSEKKLADHGTPKAEGGPTAKERGIAAAPRPPERKDLKHTSFKGPSGKQFIVPTNDRVRVLTRRSDFDWGSLHRRGAFNGCPPGLARKYNGCMPPGLAKQPSYSWLEPAWYLRDYDRAYRYRYLDGYMLRLGAGDSVLSYIPLLGGALGVGQVWPAAYEAVAFPPYYDDYYGLGPADSYRYYDDTIYRVDPGTSAIQSVAALLTGNDILIGEPMPPGYDVYNVPYGYRDQYYDGPDALYRYSDGYIYQLDPTTRLVQAAIELLA
ncbi:MAG TPA: hypothetical protein VJQ77_11040 [Novosphingobium sp.]|nr:hypothetical protein [Novosphingobium sp.]